ncbi:MAG: glycosyltransferase [Candidatus Thorarchaeota archaeon]
MTPLKLRIVMTLYNTLHSDTRVIREVQALKNFGHSVRVIDICTSESIEQKMDSVIEIPVAKVSMDKRASFLALIKFIIACFRQLMRMRSEIDVVHAHDLTSLPAAGFFKLLNPRIKLIYDSHELFPEAARDKLSYLHYLIFLGLELLSSMRIDGLIGVSSQAVKILSRRTRTPGTLLRNLPDLDQIVDALGYLPKWKAQNNTPLRIAYAGAVLPNRGYEMLPMVSQILSSRNLSFEFWIIGDGPILPELRNSIEDLNLTHLFRFTGAVPFVTLLEMLSECDIAIGLYEGLSNNHTSLSNKIFEYLAIGIPFIFTNLNQTSIFLKQSHAMIINTPFNEIEVADAITSLLADPIRMQQISEAGPTMIEQELNWNNESIKLLELYQKLSLDS